MDGINLFVDIKPEIVEHSVKEEPVDNVEENQFNVNNEIPESETDENRCYKPTKRKRNKVLVEWTDEAITKLISAVKKKNFLWNAQHEYYKCRSFRDMAWQDLSDNVFNNEYDASQLNAKWTNLRIQFKSYCAKSKKTKAGQGTGEKKISWKFYDQLMFVTAVEEQQSTLSESNSAFGSVSDEEYTSKSPEVATRNKRIKLTTPINNCKLIALKGMKRALQKRDEVDSFQVFGNFIAEELRKIPDLRLANKMQRKITRFVMDCMDELDGCSSV